MSFFTWIIKNAITTSESSFSITQALWYDRLGIDFSDSRNWYFPHCLQISKAHGPAGVLSHTGHRYFHWLIPFFKQKSDNYLWLFSVACVSGRTGSDRFPTGHWPATRGGVKPPNHPLSTPPAAPTWSGGRRCVRGWCGGILAGRQPDW